MIKIISILLALCISCSACQKTTKQLANTKASADKPEYTTEVDVNKSPAS